MTYDDLRQSLAILELPERATLREIKARHRELVKHFHPDAGESDDPERIRYINAAYRIITEYVTAYRFSFDEDEFYDQNPEERLRSQFSMDPWGNR